MSKFSKTVNNFKFPASFPTEAIEFALNYKPKSSDVFVVTYPKCGTTWAKMIVNLILNDGKPRENEIEYVMNSYIEMRGNACLNASHNPTVIKTHLSFDLMPYNESTKYLIVFRNPKDACVSFYYYLKELSKKYPNMRSDFDFHEFFKDWIKGETPSGDFFEYTLTFWSHRFDANICFLVYEEMKRNPREAVLKIGQFLGEEYVSKLTDNNELMLNKVLENSTVDSMKPALNFNPLVRKGIVGDWKSLFTKDESDLVDQKVKQLFSGTDLQNLWTEEMKW